MSKTIVARSIVTFVQAVPMTRQEYNDLRGWQLPENENGDDAGFLVEDQEGQKNTPQYEGFVQWLPKDEFERKFIVENADTQLPKFVGDSNPTDEQAIEQQIQDKGLNAPRITPDHIDSVIQSVQYFTAGDGAYGYQTRDETVDTATYPEALNLLTFCVITLKNGFTVTGESACASPENFDEEIGKKIAFENARNKIWLLEGYLLKQKLYEQSKPTTFQERVILEQKELQTKVDALNALLVKGQPEFIDDEQWQLLNEQHKHMTEYNVTLLQRIGSFEV